MLALLTHLPTAGKSLRKSSKRNLHKRGPRVPLFQFIIGPKCPLLSHQLHDYLGIIFSRARPIVVSSRTNGSEMERNDRLAFSNEPASVTGYSRVKVRTFYSAQRADNHLMIEDLKNIKV